MSRIPIRARVLKRGDDWLVILPTGRRVLYYYWRNAVLDANHAVRKERAFEEDKKRDIRRWNESRGRRTR